ncbi:uncharacterized protein [Drosophila pseudoobscura]|uniref:Uncharacterized protein isoform X2 n=1 Tax=Drosophila pseudoobscura pseudoobscura TaxID=46245 RepID=A0A6I8VXD6_DROPS|nr:uncharacterized protein LOC26534138 isoform X2 [Drosophila pseudoobscura]XP_033235232.1 uncharacterized protein LOC26534138 isoform X2 [Drosophila pseudoobscura]XP_033235233.1 uncharacterized protein LOC26534138 isoform X2 [Drosophila pseudoobscura]XP_033235234.1 uncharacterized protein LOC26534138 isoform X2 [Drosophila pseudoobscura]
MVIWMHIFTNNIFNKKPPRTDNKFNLWLKSGHKECLWILLLASWEILVVVSPFLDVRCPTKAAREDRLHSSKHIKIDHHRNYMFRRLE